ncbi:MAG: nuclear transport factor 2 family protein [Acidobacteria bacterium]|nr:nuclear transport factor 2 family protein [Acidobacteriota bacterium]
MKKTRLAFLSLVITATVLLAACADNNEALLEIQDRARIEKLMWDYARALDSRDAEAYVATFTEDGQFGRGENAVKGREALREMMGSFRKSEPASQAESPAVPAMYHMTANHHIEFIDRDHANFHGYWFSFIAAGGENPQTNLAGVGREVNELVRVDGKWLIRVRDVRPQD